MENFFFYYIDFAVLAICIILTLLYTSQLSKKSVLSVRKVPLFFLLFGAMLVLSSMCGHLTEISFRAIQKVIAGNFVYDFKFYSLILMGVVFLSISGYMLLQAKAWCLGDKQGKTNFIKSAITISLLSAPTAFLTPIGLLPTMACTLSLIALPFTVKQASKKLQLQNI